MAKRTVLYYKQNVVVVRYCWRSLYDCIRLKLFVGGMGIRRGQAQSV